MTPTTSPFTIDSGVPSDELAAASSSGCPPCGGRVSSVAPGSIAEECGIGLNDLLISIDEHQLRDVIDYRFWSSAPELTLRFLRGNEQHEVEIEKDWDEELGIEFAEPLFDGIRRCRNNCGFCFVKNLPRGLRRTLYIKDDDFRLSFLHGNFITLTNLAEADLDRIEEQRLSPLYLSVHATERELRSRLMGHHVPDILEQIDELGRRRIEIHAQVVLCPGLNDGPHLEQTLSDLTVRHQTVRSVAVVPVGLTRFCQAPQLRTYRPEEARHLVRWITPIQKSFRQRLGRSVVYLSDEFYSLSGIQVPSAHCYDGFPQLENGVGLVRRLLASWANCRRQLPTAIPRARVVGWICGVSAYSTLQRLAREMNRVGGLRVELFPVANEFFGNSVTVSGLLTGTDVTAVLKGTRVDGWVLPRAMFDSGGHRTLDGMTLEEISGESCDPVTVASSCEQLLKLSLFGGAPCAE